MKIVHIGTAKKLSKKEQELERAKEWVLKQKAINSKRAMAFFAKEIQEIREKDPDFMVSRLAQI